MIKQGDCLELRYYNGNKSIFNFNLEYYICGIYKFKQTKNTLMFEFIKEISSNPRIPFIQNTKTIQNTKSTSNSRPFHGIR
jgi:hypothetical protein